MGGLIQLNTKKKFTCSEVDQILPVILKLTERAMAKIKVIQGQILSLKDSDGDIEKQSLDEIDEVINFWELQMKKLGALPKGLWLADFDKGDGYFCWKYPETRIMFEHGYREGFRNGG